jgi:hypothetical protein
MAIKFSLIITTTTIIAIANPTTVPSTALKNSCLNCHTKQKIPSELIYRRYLMRYSIDKKMQKRILAYLKNPAPSNSIMPKQFFLKFPMKKRLDINGSILERDIKGYLDYFNIKNKLKVSKN